MERKLVYDVGAHMGDDSYVYLRMGYRVIAVEANSFLLEQLKKRFEQDIQKENFTVLNYAIAEKDNRKIEFYIGVDSSKSSVREIEGTQPVTVVGQRLGTIMSTYGEPYFCKIDIEDADITALKSMDHFLPAYISVEVSGKSLKEIQRSPKYLFDTLNVLHGMGYKKFKLVDQENLVVLSSSSYYRKRKTLWGRIETMLVKKLRLTSRDRFRRQFGLSVDSELSGFPGDNLPGVWINYKTAAKLLTFHFEEFCSICKDPNFIFWVDVHASQES